MRVLHLINSNDNHGLLLDLTKELRKAGTTILLATLAGPGPLHETAKRLGYEAIALDVKHRREYPLAILDLARLLRRLRIDVVHTHLTDPTIVGLTAACLAGVRGRVMTRHHADERLIYNSRTGVMVDRMIERFLCKHTIAISRAVERALTDIDKIPTARIRRVPNGYEWDRVRSSPEAAQAVRRALGFDDRHFLFCHVGRITWVAPQKSYMKGQDRLIRAFAAAKFPDTAHMIFLGNGDQKGLRELARSLGVERQSVFLGWRDDRFDVMAACDLIVHPSLHEAQCQVLIEAMALGRSVIASDVGAAEDIVLNGKTGWLIPARDDAALLAAMQEAISDRTRLDHYSKAGRTLVHELYPIERMACGYQAIYTEDLRC